MIRIQNVRVSRRLVAVVMGIAAVLLVTGVGLLADITGPKPDHEVKVVSFSPQGATQREVNVTIKFSNDLVPADSVNRPVESIPLMVTPEIEGLARWTSTDELTIYAGNPLKPATEYRAIVKSGRGYVHGNAIKRDQEFTFYTPPLSVRVSRYHAQRTRDNNGQARLVFDLDFNYPVSREELETALRVHGRQHATRSRLPVIWPDTTLDGTAPTASARQFRLATEPFDLNDEEQSYQLLLDDGFRCAECGRGLKTEFTYTMSVPRNPRMDLRVSEVLAQRAGKQGVIQVRFSSQIPVEEAREYISLEPAVPFSVEPGWRGVRLRGDFRPQATYTVNIASGMMSSNGELMERGSTHTVIMGDLQPSIRFTSPGVYLPREGSRLLKIATVNIDTLSLEVSQVFANNLVPYLATGSDRSGYAHGWAPAYGRSTFIEDFPLTGQKNDELVSTIDLGEIVGDTLQGVFVVSARSRSSRWNRDTRHVMLTDIGVLARMSERHLMVWANSLSEAQPVKKAEVTLYSRNNQVLVEGKTNSKGVVVFEDLADQVGSFEPFLISVQKDGDLSYLRLDNSRLATSDFDVSGRPYLNGSYEAFLFADRGVYRPGDTAHVVSMVRGEDGVMPGEFPYLLRVVDPRGRVFSEYRGAAGLAMQEFAIGFAVDVPTGEYTATAYLTDSLVLGRTEFLVEEFMPDRIKVRVGTDRAEYDVGDTMVVDVDADYLYGAPATGLKVKSEVVLSPTDFAPPGYGRYTFQVPERNVPVKRVSLGESVLSDSGVITMRHVVGSDHRPPSGLTAQVWATVTEAGGRAVSSFVECDLHPYARYVGVNANLDGYAKTGEPVTVDLVVLRSDGTPQVTDSVQVVFARMVYNSMLQRQPDGSYRFVSERTEEPVDSTWVRVGPAKSTVTFTPVDYGRYRVTATDASGGHSAATEFFASGWGRVPWSMEEPDRLQLDLDRTDYTPGARARLQVRAPFGGRLLVTVENQTVEEYMVLDLPENTGEVEIPVKREYEPNVYVSATLIRPAAEIHKGMPARAYGLIPLKVRAEDRRLEVTVTTPEEIRPRTDLSVQVNTDGYGETRLTVAAVDAGILQLTGFGSPDPFEFFCGKRRPALDGYDLYSLVYPESERAGSHLSPPGGVSDFRSKQHLNPFQARRVNVVSLWSGVLTADSTGGVDLSLPVPHFNGQLVVMAVATEGDRFGSGSASLLVREPIILQESFPRFVAPNDKVKGVVTVFNGLDSTATIRVGAECTGPARLTDTSIKRVTLRAGTQGVVEFPFEADAVPGKVSVNLSAIAGEESSRVGFELTNRPPSPLETKYGSGAVTGDSSAVFEIPDSWVAGTGQYVLRTSSLSALQLKRNIEYLLSYPYGCVEQMTSRLFPLLYFEELAEFVRPELLAGRGHEYYVAEGIERLLRFQRDDGSFSYWPGGGRIHNWSSVYAAHFLVEARLAGYEVNESGYRRAIRFLENIARDKGFPDVTTEHRIYACLALAKAGRMDNKLYNYLSGLNTSELPVYSVYQLASAQALAGDIESARAVVPLDIQPDLSEPETGGNFSSGVRDDAILLDLLLEVEPGNPSAAVLARSLLERSRIGRWYNTQATAMALMVLGKYFGRVEHSAFSGEISIEGLETHQIDTADFVLTADDIGGRQIEITIDGKGPCFYYWQASGVPAEADHTGFERGIKIRREYLDTDGEPVDLGRVTLGDQLVGHIEVTSSNRRLANTVIADLLPAGFELENSRLATSAQMPWLPSDMSAPDYRDIRDDRLLLFVTLPAERTLHFFYSLRAISAGDFVVPPVAAECMYNPLIAGSGSAGRVTVSRHGEESGKTEATPE